MAQNDTQTPQALNRPVPVFDPARGLLNNDHFQIAYVTNDIDEAVRIFRERFGIGHFRESDADLPSGGWIRVRAAWIGNMAYEIISASGPGMELYTDWVAASAPFAIRHHHFGFLIADDESWQALERQIEAGGWTVRQRGDDPQFGRTANIEVPELGHYLEYIQPGPDLLARLNATPAW